MNKKQRPTSMSVQYSKEVSGTPSESGLLATSDLNIAPCVNLYLVLVNSSNLSWFQNFSLRRSGFTPLWPSSKSFLVQIPEVWVRCSNIVRTVWYRTVDFLSLWKFCQNYYRTGTVITFQMNSSTIPLPYGTELWQLLFHAVSWLFNRESTESYLEIITQRITTMTFILSPCKYVEYNKKWYCSILHIIVTDCCYMTFL